MVRRVGRTRYDVPYLPEKRIIAEADWLLAEYGAKRGLVAAPPVPVEDIVEIHLQLAFEFQDLRQRFGAGDVLGALWIHKRIIGVDEKLNPNGFPAKLGRF